MRGLGAPDRALATSAATSSHDPRGAGGAGPGEYSSTLACGQGWRSRIGPGLLSPGQRTQSKEGVTRSGMRCRRPGAILGANLPVAPGRRSQGMRKVLGLRSCHSVAEPEATEGSRCRQAPRGRTPAVREEPREPMDQSRLRTLDADAR